MSEHASASQCVEDGATAFPLMIVVHVAGSLTRASRGGTLVNRLVPRFLLVGMLALSVMSAAPVPSQSTDGQVSSLEARLERLEERIVRSEEATAGAGLVLFVIACFCALWAQNTRRSAWLWFFLGVFFNVITLVVLLRKNSNDLQRDARRADSTGAV